jgi:hypothetical protein
MAAVAGSQKWLTLLEGFNGAVQQGELDRYRERRWGRADVLSQWLRQDALTTLSTDQGHTLYRASGGNRMAQFRSNPIAEVRDSLDFLLYDTIRLEARFDECAAEDGGYKLAGAGKEFVSFLLSLRDPTLFGPWNSYTERMLRALGRYSPALGRGRLGNRYMDVLDSLQEVRGRLGLANFRQVDEFAYFVARLAGGSSG